jgi:ubiquinone biosynthesis protein
MAIQQRAVSEEHIPHFSTFSKLFSASQMCFRFLEIAAYLLGESIRFMWRLLLNKLRRRSCSRRALLGQALAELCDSLGATFIKIGQILSTRCDLLPPEVIQPLIRLQDCTRPFAFRSVPTIIKAEFGRSLTEIFAEFEQKPLSSASVASVYQARLQNGQKVAVKIRRPDVVRKVRNDLRIMRLMARGLARLPAMKLVPVVDMIDEFGRVIERQLDFRLEAMNNRQFQEHFSQNDQVLIPALVEEYCSEAVLSMEFLEGLVRSDQLDWEESEYQESLKTGLRALYSMIFLKGFIHCDMHPGNFYFRKGGDVIILDMGFVASLNQNDRYQFSRFFFGIARNNGKDCARILYETASYKTMNFNRDAFNQAVIDLIDRSAGSNAAEFQVALFASQLFDIQRRHGLRGSTNFTMAILSLLVFEGIAKQFYPHLDFQSEARPFLVRALLQRAVPA